MEVILMDDVDRVGHEGDLIRVADGYARNYLIPRGRAVEATKGARRDLERRRKAINSREDEKRAKYEAVAEDLSSKRIIVTARAGEGDRLHGQVTTHMISDAAKEQLGIDLDRRDIDIAEPIRELGNFLIGAKLYKGVTAQLPVTVVRDEEAEEEEEALPLAEEEEEEEAEAEEDEPEAEEPEEEEEEEPED